MPKPITLLVVANPYTALDADGEPCGTCRRTDIEGHRLIGAAPDMDRSSSHEDPQKPHALKYVFHAIPEAISDSHEHRGFLRTGQLFPADKATADACGLTFHPVAVSLERAKAQAAAHHLAMFGEASPALAPSAGAPPPSAAKAAPLTVADGGKLWQSRSSSSV
jgi:hypothetical protein